MKKELQLGLFVFFGLVALAVSILLIKNIHVQSGYRVHVMFNDVAGLLEKAWVRVNGVKVGRVESISLHGRKAKVTVWIENRVKLKTDSQAKILSSGLLGVKYLEFTLGSEAAAELKNNSTIIGVETATLDTVFNKITESNFIDNLVKASENIKELTEKLNYAFTKSRMDELVKNANEILQSIKQISVDLSEVSGDTKVDVKDILKNLKTATSRLDKVLGDIEKGEAPIGKLLSDKEMGDDLKSTVASLKTASEEAKKTISRFTLFKTYWNYELRNDMELARYKSDVGIEIRPKTEKFYYIGVRNLVTQTEVSPPEPENTFDLNVGRDFGMMTLYAGVIRSTGGVGFKARPFSKNFEIQAQAYDFTRKLPESKARIDVGAKVKVGKYLKLGVGLEDIYSANNLHGSVNVNIDDEDIAYLLGFVSLP